MSESASAAPPSLVLVAKYPSESSKTRLRPALGHAGTVSFAMACLVDSLTRLATVTAGSGKEVKRYVLYAPASAKEDFEGLLRTVPGDWKADTVDVYLMGANDTAEKAILRTSLGKVMSLQPLPQ